MRLCERDYGLLVDSHVGFGIAFILNNFIKNLKLFGKLFGRHRRKIIAFEFKVFQFNIFIVLGLHPERQQK
jgi:hypothetical protein